MDPPIEINAPEIETTEQRDAYVPPLTVRGGLFGPAFDLPEGVAFRHEALRVVGTAQMENYYGVVFLTLTEEIENTAETGEDALRGGGGSISLQVSTNAGHSGYVAAPTTNPEYEWGHEDDPEYDVPPFIGDGKQHAFTTRGHDGGRRGLIIGLHGATQIAPTIDDVAIKVYSAYPGGAAAADGPTQNTVEIFDHLGNLMLTMTPDGDVEIHKGDLIQRSPNGTRYRVGVANDGSRTSIAA